MTQPALRAVPDVVAALGTAPQVVGFPALAVFNFLSGRPSPLRDDYFFPGLLTASGSTVPAQESDESATPSRSASATTGVVVLEVLEQSKVHVREDGAGPTVRSVQLTLYVPPVVGANTRPCEASAEAAVLIEGTEPITRSSIDARATRTGR